MNFYYSNYGFIRQHLNYQKNSSFTFGAQKEKNKAFELVEKIKNSQPLEQVIVPEEIQETGTVTKGEFYTISEKIRKVLQEHIARYEKIINDWTDEEKRVFHYGQSKFS